MQALYHKLLYTFDTLGIFEPIVCRSSHHREFDGRRVKKNNKKLSIQYNITSYVVE